YAYEAGSEVTFSASTFMDGGTRHVPTGYQLTGSVNSSGSGDEVTATINGDLTVTWSWQTQYRVLAAASGPGAVDVSETWVDAGTALVLTGTPEAGAALVSWTGDTADGSANGSSFTIAAVDRPMGPITANFAVG